MRFDFITIDFVSVVKHGKKPKVSVCEECDLTDAESVKKTLGSAVV